MVQLPSNIDKARILVTVKAYPKPSSKYEELVCTAGLLDGQDWIRIYPVSYRFLTDDNKYPKYSWISLDLVRKRTDFRPESYSPKQGIDEDISIESALGTKDAWSARKSFILQNVYTSMSELIDLAHGEQKISLGTVKPTEFIGFDVQEADREWKESWQDHAKQPSFSDLTEFGDAKKRDLVKKLPFDYFYRFITDGDTSPRRLKIEDWEIGALYWNCFRRASGDENLANEMVKAKYWDEFVNNKDLYLFVGTTLQYHRRNVANPFMIIGVFYPPKSDQPPLM